MIQGEGALPSPCSPATWAGHNEAMDEAGGEAACYLPYLDPEGRIGEPAISLDAGYAGPVWRVLVGTNDDAVGGCDSCEPDVAPFEGESSEDYLARLEEPAARTAAWRIVLKSQDCHVVLVMPDTAHRTVLLQYLRDLAGG